LPKPGRPAGFISGLEQCVEALEAEIRSLRSGCAWRSPLADPIASVLPYKIRNGLPDHAGVVELNEVVGVQGVHVGAARGEGG
jgi:hypothetical protein